MKETLGSLFMVQSVAAAAAPKLLTTPRSINPQEVKQPYSDHRGAIYSINSVDWGRGINSRALRARECQCFSAYQPLLPVEPSGCLLHPNSYEDAADAGVQRRPWLCGGLSIVGAQGS